MDYDIVIVGGGIAGLNLCYQIIKKTDKLKILLIEKNNYFGGRVLTSKFNKDSFDAGAGRIAGHHKRTVELLKELDLWKDKFKINSNSLIILQTLTEEEKVINKGYPNFESIFYLLLEKINELENKPKLENFTIIELIKKYLGEKYASYSKKVFEYDSELSFMNGKEAIKNLKKDFTGDKNYYVLKNKNSSIIHKLEEKLKNKIDMKLNSELLKIEKEENRYNLTIRIDKEEKIITSNKLILTIEKDGLNKLDYLFKYRQLLDLSQPRPLYRVYAKYSKNKQNKSWFDGLPKIITDLPIKFIIPVNQQSGVIMITYTDGEFTKYWKNQFNKNCFDYFLNKDLKKLFPDTDFGEIKWLAHYFWENGAHYWIPKIDVDKVIKQIRNIEEDLYIMGEVYSRNQAWIEGGLECEDILEKLI